MNWSTRLKGSTEDESIVIEVNYGSNQKGWIHDLTEWLEENIQEGDDTEQTTEN